MTGRVEQGMIKVGEDVEILGLMPVQLELVAMLAFYNMMSCICLL